MRACFSREAFHPLHTTHARKMLFATFVEYINAHTNAQTGALRSTKRLAGSAPAILQYLDAPLCCASRGHFPGKKNKQKNIITCEKQGHDHDDFALHLVKSLAPTIHRTTWCGRRQNPDTIWGKMGPLVRGVTQSTVRIERNETMRLPRRAI